MKPIEISRDMFEQHCRPRYGVGNPERMINPYWEWEIRRRVEGNAVYPSRVKHALGIDFKDKAYSPTWTSSRMGSTETVLSDGTQVSVAGEYEDWYDPDFCIYNDVTVVSPAGEISIFGYPREVFPPTDFHTATLVGERIILIGSLGYSEDRRPGVTQVFELSLADYSMKRLPSMGAAPGWIHHHQAELVGEDEITVRGGEVQEAAGGKRLLWKNHSAFAYAIATGQWRCVSLPRIRQWFLQRQDHFYWVDLPGPDFEFEHFLTAEELRDSEKPDDEQVFGRRQFTRDRMTIQLDLDMDSLEVAIEGEGLADEWVAELKARISAACGAECEMVERGR